MKNVVEYTFEMMGQKYCVVRCETIRKRKYTLAAGSYPWMTYVGCDGVIGNGMTFPALYSQADVSGRRCIFSVGPWWVDGNHSSPGYGYLSLVFLCLLRPDKLQVMLFDPNICYPTMKNMKIRGKIRGANIDLKGSDLVFWFQCYSEKLGKNINYALVGQPLNDKLMDGNINDFELNIDINNYDDWVCLGSCEKKSSLYDDLDIKELQLDKPINMGFILIPVDVKPIWTEERSTDETMNLDFESQWPVDVELLPMGTIAFYELEIDYESYYEIVQANRTLRDR